MVNFKKFFIVAATLKAVVSSPVEQKRQSSGSLDSWVASESPIALQGVLNNIGSDGSKAPGAKAGIVVASPSKTSPPCNSCSESPK